MTSRERDGKIAIEVSLLKWGIVDAPPKLFSYHFSINHVPAVIWGVKWFRITDRSEGLENMSG